MTSQLGAPVMIECYTQIFALRMWLSVKPKQITQISVSEMCDFHSVLRTLEGLFTYLFWFP